MEEDSEGPGQAGRDHSGRCGRAGRVSGGRHPSKVSSF